MAKRSSRRVRRNSTLDDPFWGKASARDFLSHGVTPPANRAQRLFNRPRYLLWTEKVLTPAYGRLPGLQKRYKLTPNLLVQTLESRSKGNTSKSRGQLYQVVELGPESGRMLNYGYPITIAAHVVQDAYIRPFKFGGVAKARAMDKPGTKYAMTLKRKSAKTPRDISAVLPNRRRTSRKNKRTSRRAR